MQCENFGIELCEVCLQPEQRMIRRQRGEDALVAARIESIGSVMPGL